MTAFVARSESCGGSVEMSRGAVTCTPPAPPAVKKVLRDSIRCNSTSFGLELVNQ